MSEVHTQFIEAQDAFVAMLADVEANRVRFTSDHAAELAGYVSTAIIYGEKTVALAQGFEDSADDDFDPVGEACDVYEGLKAMAALSTQIYGFNFYDEERELNEAADEIGSAVFDPHTPYYL